MRLTKEVEIIQASSEGGIQFDVINPETTRSHKGGYEYIFDTIDPKVLIKSSLSPHAPSNLLYEEHLSERSALLCDE